MPELKRSKVNKGVVYFGIQCDYGVIVNGISKEVDLSKEKEKVIMDFSNY